MSEQAISAPTAQSTFKRLRYRWSPRQLFADLFAKSWMEPAIPFSVLALMIAFFVITVPHYASVVNAQTIARAFSEFAFVAIAMGLSLISGGIDLSVGSIFALCDFVALYAFNLWHLPVPLVILVSMIAGGLLGSVNGFFIGYMRTRAFLTTLVTLIVYRGVFDLLNLKFSGAITLAFRTSEHWDWLGNGQLLGVPASALALILVAISGHVLLSRSRPGWHLTAVGSARRAARHAGINTPRVLFATYALSGALCGLAAAFFAARLNSTGSQTGDGYAFQALAAVMIGGISIAGGKGSIGRALIGAGIVYILGQGMILMGYPGQIAAAVNGGILLLAIAIDVKWTKNRGKAIQKSYVNPALVEYGPRPVTEADSGGPYAINERLRNTKAIGLDQVEGPEDVILDRAGRLYTGTRQGWILRFSGDDFEQREVFARIGGRPLGLAFDADENLIVCAAGMGLYGVTPQGEVYKITDQTNRTWWKLVDDSRLRLTDDLDIAPDGKIYFSEATTRFDMSTWPVDGLEGRGSGRLVCYDPVTKKTRTVVRNIRFCNGVCVAHDGQSVLYCETFGLRLMRYWIAGPKNGQTEAVIPNLPGSPDNINRASDGGYWLALVAMRAPVYDVAMRMPGFRLRMIKQLPFDEWLFPGINNGCIVKLNANGEAVESYWDPGGESHPTLTSMREHRGHLYLGGLENNRIGRIKLEDANPNWVSYDSYWGSN